MAAATSMSGTQRSAVWGFIALLATLAFLRSLAPERTEKAVRHLISSPTSTNVGQEAADAQLDDLKEELQRERAALERLREELSQKQKELDERKNDSTPAEEESIKNADELGITLSDEDPDAFTDNSTEDVQPETGDADAYEAESEPNAGSDDSVEDKNGVQGLVFDEDEPVPNLSEEECPIIVIPESTRAGLGMQINHLWSSLSLTLSVRNACLVIPPVMADDGTENFRPVPFRELFDETVLGQTGLRFVPVRTCEKHGVSTVFDDAGAESAIVKNFAAFVQESYPHLAEETTLVHADSKGWRFPNEAEINGDVTAVASYVQSKLSEKPGRHCIGIGRMRADIEINGDVLQYFRAAPSIAEYVSEKFPLANETLFIKLRWNRAHCDKARTEDGTVCIFTDNIIPTEEYVDAIAYTATNIGASNIYISAPAHVPEDVSAYIGSHLKILEPILLDVGGDVFTANIIERELALRARRFVSDGGAWGDTVQMAKSVQNPETFEEGLNSFKMVEDWKAAGWARDSPFLLGRHQAKESSLSTGDVIGSEAVQQSIDNRQSPDENALQAIEEPRQQGTEMSSKSGEMLQSASDKESNPENTQPRADIAPTEYVPPDSFVPIDDDEEEMRHFRSQRDEQYSAESPLRIGHTNDQIAHQALLSQNTEGVPADENLGSVRIEGAVAEEEIGVSP